MVSKRLMGAVAVLALAAQSPVAQDGPWRVGEAAPHVHLPDITTGEAVDLAAYRGQRVLIAEFASW